MKYDELCEIRNISINDETDWCWPISDSGAFSGPKDDWLNEHSHKYYKYLKNRDVIITAGANCGMYARFYAKTFQRVYAFEPDPLNFYCLVNNVQYDNVYKFQMALGDECKLVDIDSSSYTNVGTHTIKEGSKIPMITIDTLKLDACDIIQLDVEGYELRVLQGADQTIKKYWPVITAENGHYCEQFLKELGYTGIDQSRSDKIFVKQ